MTWKIRHEGSPRTVEGLSTANVIDGLREGQWEPTDEVMGAADRDWQPIEGHPQFAETALDLEPPPPKLHEDETRLDMNPLIDVCLVLLIFFILTTSYAALQKVLDVPVSTASENNPKTRPRTKEDIEKTTIWVEARQEGGRPVIRVEGREVSPLNLMAAINQYKGQKGKQLLLDASEDVDWDTVVKIQDAAKGVGIQKILVPMQQQPAAK